MLFQKLRATLTYTGFWNACSVFVSREENAFYAVKITAWLNVYTNMQIIRIIFNIDPTRLFLSGFRWRRRQEKLTVFGPVLQKSQFFDTLDTSSQVAPCESDVSSCHKVQHGVIRWNLLHLCVTVMFHRCADFWYFYRKVSEGTSRQWLGFIFGMSLVAS